MKQYCLKCGNPTEYSLTKPKFCSKCGQSFNQNISNAANKVESIKISKINIENEDFDESDDNEITKIPDITSLEIEELSFPESKGETLGSIMNNLGSEDKTRTKRKKGKKIPKKEKNKILDEILSEGRSLRSKK